MHRADLVQNNPVCASDNKTMSEFRTKAFDYLALGGSDRLMYLAPTKVNLSMA